MVTKYQSISAHSAFQAFRALQNPDLFRNEHYRQAALAVAAGIAIRLIIAIPVSLLTNYGARAAMTRIHE